MPGDSDDKIKVGDLVRVIAIFPHAIIDTRESDPGLGLVLESRRAESQVPEYSKRFPFYQKFPIETEVLVHWPRTKETTWEWSAILEKVVKGKDSS